MKIGVLGNCQAWGLAQSIEALRPGDEVVVLSPHDPQSRTAGYAARQLVRLADCDHVFYQASLGAAIMGVNLREFAADRPEALAFPTIVSTQQLPDCHFLFRDGGGAMPGVTGVCHSAIIAGAWQAGLPAARVPALFNAFTYAHLGYRVDYDPQTEPLAKEAARYGYDYADFLAGRRGRYMHTHHHPMIGILFETARQALGKIGLDWNADAALPEDTLAQAVIWPAYPGLGGPAMADAADPEGLIFTGSGSDRLTLRDFIAASYEIYAKETVRFSNPHSDRMRDFVQAHVIAA